MKLIVRHLSSFLVAAVVSVLVISAISLLFVPTVRDFVSTLFVDEQNFVEDEGGPAAPTITCPNENVSLLINDTVNLFDGITAVSSSGTDLTAQLESDYSKPNLDERQQVFIYEILPNNTRVLSPEINTARPGIWKVFYLVTDGTESAVLTITYTVTQS